MGGVFVFKQPPPGFITEYFGGGGKGGTSTSTVSIPPEVLARYNAVNARAENVATQPFQKYGGEFVAGLSDTQKTGIQGTNAAAGQAQPYFDAATGLTMSGAKDVGPLTQNQIGYYQNPFTQAVVDPTLKALEQQQGQQRSQQQTQAIKSGGMNTGRSAVERALLSGQQGLATSQAIAPLYQQGYQQAVQTAQGQQGVVAADLARRMQAGQQIANLGTGAQTAALQGSQAQMAAGQVEQQTKQAGDTAEYQQFLQERGYPFQVAQFLANIAMGTGALSGSTTTTQQPGGFFSDKRLKEDVKEIGKTNDGQPIYSYKYKGDDRTQIGLMAQDVEKKHPEAVGLMGGYKTVDYKKATEGAERPHKDMGGGLMPNNFDASSMGGAVTADSGGQNFMRGGYVGGGLVGNDDWSQIIAANKAALGVYGGAQPMGGGSPGATGIVPAASLPTPKLVTASAPPQQRPSGLSSAMQTGKDIAGAYKMGKEGLVGSAPTADDKTGSAGLIGGQGKLEGQNIFSKGKDFFSDMFKAEGGLIVPRHAYADGGMSEGEEAIPYDPSDVMGSKDPMEGVLKAGSQKHEMLKPSGTGGGGGGGSGLGIGKMAGSVIGSAFGPLGSMAGSALGSLLPFAEGGLVPRERHDGEDGNVVGTAPKYLIEPQNREDMDPHWQSLINRIYGGEGGYDKSGQPRYNIRQGGQETFDVEAGHPGKRPAQGGVSSAAGAGQFINDTWNRVTGGAPMTKGYQDAATKALAAQDYKARTGRDLDVDLKEQGLAPDIIKTLAPTWTSLGNAPSPPGLIGHGLQPAAPSGGEGKKSLGDTLTSEGFVVPALGFLGSMLASNKPNLGQALGEGIMGGVGAYQSQQKQLADIAKTKAETGQMLPVATARNIEAANKLATGLMQYNASLPPGSPKLTLQQYAKIVGYEGPLPSGTEQAASTATKEAKPAGAAPGEVKVAEPASRNWSFSPDEKESLVINYPNGTVVPASKDPLYLSKYADRYTTMGEGWAKEQAEAARKSAEEIVRSGKTVDVNGNVVSLPGAIESGQKQKIGEGLAKEALEFNEAAQKYRSEAQNILGVLDDLGKNYSILRSGPDSAARANFDRMMKLIDPNNKFPNIHPDESWNAGRYDKAVKDAFQLSIAQLTALSPRAPKAELDTLARTIPLPGLDAGAIQDLIGDAKARVEWNMKMHDAFDVNRDLDLNKFKKKFETDTPFDKFKAEVKKTIPAAAGTQQQRDQASAIPTIRSDEEYNAIKSGATYIAPDGTTRRKP